jgi:hypothetical protein
MSSKLLDIDGSFKIGDLSCAALFESADKLISEIVKIGKTDNMDVVDLHLFENYCKKTLTEKFDVERRKCVMVKRRKD